MTAPAAVVVIPCHNEADYLQPVITALGAQLPELPHWRTVLVEDSSNDDTARLVDAAAAHPQLRAHHVRLGSPGAARSAGIALATGHVAGPPIEWVITTDADVTLPADWLSRWATALEAAQPDEAIGALNGEEDQAHLLAPFPRAAQLSDAFGAVAGRAEELLGVTNLNGVNHAVRLRAYQTCGPYLQPQAPGPHGMEQLAGEDWDLGLRLRLAGYRIDPVAIRVADRGRRLLADLVAYLDGSAYEGPFRRVLASGPATDLTAEQLRSLWPGAQRRALLHFYAKPLLAQPDLLRGDIGLSAPTVARLQTWMARWPSPTFSESRNGFLYGRLAHFTDTFAALLLSELGLSSSPPWPAASGSSLSGSSVGGSIVTHRSPITCVEHHAASGRLFTGGYDGRVVGWAGRGETGHGAGVALAEPAGAATPAGATRWTVQLDDLVNDVRLSPDGTRLAVAVADGTVVVLDPADGRHQLVLGPHGDDVNVVRWFPDGTGLVCVMDHLDPVVRLWHGKDGRWESRQLIGHSSGVFGAAVDPRGRRLATAAEDGTARIWDLDSLRALSVLQHPGDPEAIDWSPDGRLIATGCDDKVCRLWDPEAGTVVRELRDAGAAVRFVRFSADGSHLLVGAYDATLRQYDTATWQVQAEHRHPLQWERAATFAGDAVVVASFGGNPIVHPGATVVSGRGEAPIVSPTFGINAMARAGVCLALGRDDGSVLRLASDASPAELRPPVERVQANAHVSNAHAASNAHASNAHASNAHASIVNCVAFSPDGTLLASGDYRGTIRIASHNHAEGSSGVVQAYTGGGPINSLVWDPHGGSLFSAGYDGVVRQWSPDGAALAAWPAHHGPVKSLTFSVPTGLLVAGSSDGTLSAWVPPPPPPLGERWQHVEPAWRAAHPELVLVNAVAADAVGVVVSASRDLLVRRWDASTGDLLEVLPRAHRKSVKAVATSAEGDWLVSGSYDGTAVLWQRHRDGWRWVRLVHHGPPGVPAVALGPPAGDGAPQWVDTAGWDGSVARWSPRGTLVAVLHAPQRR